MKITLVVEPPRLPLPPFPAGPERFHRFANELGRYTNTAVPVVNEITPRSLPEGFVLWETCGDPDRLLERFAQSARDDLAARTVLLNVSRQETLSQLEQYGFAAALDSLTFSHWSGNPSARVGLFGLRELADVIGVSCAALRSLNSKRYSFLQAERHQDLPQLLADYLAAYERSRRPADRLYHIESLYGIMPDNFLPPMSGARAVYHRLGNTSDNIKEVQYAGV